MSASVYSATQGGHNKHHLRALILFKILALYKSFNYLLTYFTIANGLFCLLRTTLTVVYYERKHRPRSL